jgi:hypothetical protein
LRLCSLAPKTSMVSLVETSSFRPFNDFDIREQIYR